MAQGQMNIFGCDGSKSGPPAQNFDSPLWLCLCDTLWFSVVKVCKKD
jgi:hypothetical protein